MNEVLDFIRRFRAYEKDDVLDKTFRQGFCYWFAYMLAGRFPGAKIWYEYLEGHFLTEIDGRLYDVRGDVTELYPAREKMYSEEYWTKIPSIVDGCILKTA